MVQRSGENKVSRRIGVLWQLEKNKTCWTTMQQGTKWAKQVIDTKEL